MSDDDNFWTQGLMRQADGLQDKLKSVEKRESLLLTALRKIAKDYVPEGKRQDCPSCDYDGYIQSVTHHPECVYVLAKNAVKANELSRRPKK